MVVVGGGDVSMWQMGPMGPNATQMLVKMLCSTCGHKQLESAAEEKMDLEYTS